MTRQFENDANPAYHAKTTAQEILKDFEGERLDYFVTGFGTGGTLKGVASVLKDKRPETKIVVCEPETAPMLKSHQPQERKPDGSAASRHPAWKPHPVSGLEPGFHSQDRRRCRGDEADRRDHPHSRPGRHQGEPAAGAA